MLDITKPMNRQQMEQFVAECIAEREAEEARLRSELRYKLARWREIFHGGQHNLLIIAKLTGVDVKVVEHFKIDIERNPSCEMASWATAT